MLIRKKIFLIFLGIFLLYGTVDYVIQRLVIFPSFLQLEHNEAVENLERVINAITREINYLKNFCFDWSAWDDTYDFVESRTQEYIKSNLVSITFFDNNLNLLYICDLNGKVIWGKAYDLETKKTIQLTDFPKNGFPKNHPLLAYKLGKIPVNELGVAGVFMTKQGPMLIASRPIITSNNKGPMRGYLIMGRFFNQDLINKLAEQTRIDFQILITKTNLVTEFPYQIEKLSSNSLLISKIFPDINGNTIFLIKVKLPRKIVKHGLTNIRYALFSIIISGLIVLIVMMFILQRTITCPLQYLTKHVLAVKEKTDFSLHLSMQRQDEIGILAREFDSMLAKIEEQTFELERANGELKKDINKHDQAEKDLQTANKKLELLATMDGLTQIANRRKFDEYIEQLWKQLERDKKTISLIMCDVDCFKLYNDTYGHQLGDDCLRAVAQAICKHTKRPLDLAARYGGEEFAVILPDTDSNSALHIANAIRKEVQQLKITHASSWVKQCVTLSLGVSNLKPNISFSVKLFIELADKALYEAKKQGRNGIVLKTEEHIKSLL